MSGKSISACQILALILVSGLIVIVRSSGDVFTASFRIKNLLKTRQKVIDELDDYIHEEEKRLRDIKEVVNRYRVEQQKSLKDVESYVGNPINAYILIKGLTVDLDHISSKYHIKSTKESTYEYENESNERNLSSVDLEGAAMALRRLQRIYKMKVEDIANGVLDGQIYGLAMTASDCFHLGVIMLRNRDYLSSLEWHMEALNRFKSPHNEDDSITEIDILECIAASYYRLGDLESASKWAMKVLAIDPNHKRTQSNIYMYNHIMEQNSDKYASNRHENKKVAASADDANDNAKDSHEIGKENKHYTYTKDATESKRMKNDTDANKSSTTDNIKESTTSDITEEEKAQIIAKVLDSRKDMIMYTALCRGEFDLPPQVAAKLTCRYINDKPFLKLAPIKAEHWYFDPDVTLFHDVISDEEIEHLKLLSAPQLERAKVAGPNLTGVYANFRISQNAFLSDEDSDVIARLSRRVGDCTGLSSQWTEELQVANYGLGGHYEPHYDWRGRVARNIKPIGHERIATAMFYLSDVAQGGATVFPKLGLSVFPKKGSAIFWINLLSSGEGDRATKHAACPVLEGSKWVANKWIKLQGQEFVRPCGLEHLGETFVRDLPKPVPKPEVVDPTQVPWRA